MEPSPSLLKPGKKLEIYVPSIDSYYQLLISFSGKKTFTVKEIKDQQKIKGPIRLRLPEGQTYPLFISDKRHVYSGITKIIERREEGGLISYVIERPQEYNVRERRQYIRVSYMNKLKYMADNQQEPIFSKTAQSVDISGGGMRLIVDDYYPPGTLLHVKLRFDSNEFTVSGKVTWSLQKKKSYWLGLNFQDIARTEQDYIINYVFSKMRRHTR